jgi:ubiquinone/menaquinone biosynthesis C-methylase UbiE
MMNKRTLKVEKLARIYDDEIAPVWAARFGKMLLRNLALPGRSQVLDVSCGTGYPTIEIVRRMTEGSRLIAIDSSSAMLDVARRKIADLGPLAKRVFFRTESAAPKLSFADDVYDLVVCNLGLLEMPSLETAIRDFARVAKHGGEVRCTLPLAGTFQEFHDLYREVLIKHDKHEALDRLERYVASYPAIEQVERCMKSAGLVGEMVVEEFTLLFKSSREFFFAPVIEYGPLSDWKDVAGGGQEMQDVFWYIKESIDAYFDGRPFQVTVTAGCLIGKKLEARAPTPLPVRASDPELTIEPPPRIATGSVQLDDPDELDIEELAADAAEDEEDTDDHEPAAEISIEEDLDAFMDGRPRPPHLDD